METGGFKNNMDESKRQEILRKHQIVERTNKEVVIRKLLQDTLTPDDQSKQTFRDFKKILIDYFTNSTQNIDDPKYIHDKTQSLIEKISTRGNTTIVSGTEFITDNLISRPVFIATNHLCLYKLAIINPNSDLGVDDAGVEEMYSLPLFHASNYPVAQLLRDSLYIAAYEFPGTIGKIQKAAGGVIIKLKEELEMSNGQTGVETLISESRKFFAQHPNAALSILPEGKTSGKSNGISPYDLEEFRTGAFVVAAQLEVPIIPVTQKFINNKFEVKILKPIYLNNRTTKNEFADVAASTREEMQSHLNN